MASSLMRYVLKIIFWDFGNVLVPFKVDEFILDLAYLFRINRHDMHNFFNQFTPAVPGKSPTWFWHSIEEDRYWTARNIYEVFCDYFKVYPAFSDFVAMFNKALQEDPEHSALFLNLSRRIYESGYVQGLISNANVIHVEKMKGQFGHLLTYMDERFLYFSCDLNARKSDKPDFFSRIFDEVTSHTRIPREHMLFIDDRDDNIEGCRKAGVEAVRFTVAKGFFALEDILAGHGFNIKKD